MKIKYALLPKISVITWIALIIFLFYFSTVVLAEHVYTNDDLKKYKGHYNIEKTEPSSSNTGTTGTEATKTAGTVKIYSQGLQWNDISGGYTDYSWKVKLHNTGRIAKSVDIEFRLLDGKGYILDKTYKTVSLGGYETETFRGTGMVKNRLAQEVKRTEVVINVH